MGIRKLIDQSFYRWGELIIRRKWVIAVLFLLLTGFMGSQLRYLTMDTSSEGFFHPDDPLILSYEAFRDQFGRDEMIVLLIHSENIFSKEFLTKLTQLHEEIENTVPSIKDVNSLVNARKTVGQEGALLVEDLLANLPETPEEVTALKTYVLSNPLYQNLLIDEKGTYTLLAIKTEAWSSIGTKNESTQGFNTSTETVQTKRLPLTEQENSAIIAAVEQIKNKYQGADFQISFTGSPVVTDFLKKSMQKDMRKFTLMALALIALFLGLTFRRFSGMFLPLITVILSLVYTISLMAQTGTPMKLPTQIMPSFLLAVGVGAAVHLMSMFYKDFNRDKGNKEQAIKDALEHSGLPIFMTSLTTAAGLASFASAKVAPIADLGMFAAIGVMIAFILTVTMIPCFLAIMPVRSLAYHEQDEKLPLTERFLMWIGDFANSKPWLVIGFSAVIVLAALVGTTKLRLAHNVLIWFPADSPIRQQTVIMDEHLRGTVSLEMVIDTGKENGLHDPEVMKAMAQLETFAQNYQQPGDSQPMMGKAFGLATMLKEINQALNENDPKFYVIPDDQAMIAQEFLLFENSGSDDLEDQVDSVFSKARLTAKAPWLESQAYIPAITAIESEANRLFGDKAKISSTGMISLFAGTVDIMMHSMVTSYAIAGIVITLMMILLIGRIKVGLISMIPNFSPIILVLGLMGWMGIPLDMFTLLIGSIAIGLAVDDTIHFFHNYRKYYGETKSSRIAIEQTLATAGRAMLVSSIVLTLGFWVFCFASMNNLFNFGLLTGLAMILAFLADVLLSPALLTVLDRHPEED